MKKLVRFSHIALFILCVACVATLHASASQAKPLSAQPTTIDSAYVKSLEERLAESENAVQSLSSKVETLRVSVQKQEIEAPYYKELLKQQTAIFCLIVTLALGLTAFFSARSFKHEVDQVGADFKRDVGQVRSEFEQTKLHQLQEFNNFKASLVPLELRLRSVRGNTAQLIATYELQFGAGKLTAFRYWVFAAEESAESWRLEDRSGRKTRYLNTVKTTLTNARNMIAELPTDIQSKASMRDVAEDIFDALNNLILQDNKEIRNLSAEVLADFNRYMGSERDAPKSK